MAISPPVWLFNIHIWLFFPKCSFWSQIGILVCNFGCLPSKIVQSSQVLKTFMMTTFSLPPLLTQMTHMAVRIIQSNIRAYLTLRDFRWWKLINQLKPVLAIRKTEEERQELEVRSGSDDVTSCLLHMFQFVYFLTCSCVPRSLNLTL